MSRETPVSERESQNAPKKPAPRKPAIDFEPFGWLPQLTQREVRLERALAHFSEGDRLPLGLRWLEEGIGGAIAIDRPEILWRASGLQRPNLVAQFTAPRLVTRLALGVEIALAHTVVDRLLGFDRRLAESRLQLSPVEWGVWTFLILRALDTFSADAAGNRQPGDRGYFGPRDLTLDRVGPDPFDAADLGSIVTIRWPVRAGNVAGAVRLWLAESVVQHWLSSALAPAAGDEQRVSRPETIEGLPRSEGSLPRGELTSAWRAEAGLVNMPQGLGRLRVGAVLPIADSPLTGSPRSPSGPVDLVLEVTNDRNSRFRIPTRPIADTGGRLVRVEAGLLEEPRPRDPIASTRNESKPMSPPPTAPNPAEPAVAPLDVPVTLTVELGRVNLTLNQLATVKPGDIIELGRHSRAHVELTSNGRLVARAELVLLDTELGVRVTNVFL